MGYEDPHLLLITTEDDDARQAALEMKHQQDTTYGIYYNDHIPGCVYHCVYPTIKRAKAAARQRLGVFQDRLDIHRSRTESQRKAQGVERYRTRQVEIEAIYCTNDNLENIKAFTGMALLLGIDQPRLRVASGAYQYVHFGDWIAKDNDGFRVISTSELNQWFEPIEDQE
jgi:hypothetical protein